MQTLAFSGGVNSSQIKLNEDTAQLVVRSYVKVKEPIVPSRKIRFHLTSMPFSISALDYWIKSNYSIQYTKHFGKKNKGEVLAKQPHSVTIVRYPEGNIYCYVVLDKSRRQKVISYPNNSDPLQKPVSRILKLLLLANVQENTRRLLWAQRNGVKQVLQNLHGNKIISYKKIKVQTKSAVQDLPANTTQLPESKGGQPVLKTINGKQLPVLRIKGKRRENVGKRMILPAKPAKQS
jgi:hypothetical protein